MATNSKGFLDAVVESYGKYPTAYKTAAAVVLGAAFIPVVSYWLGGIIGGGVYQAYKHAVKKESSPPTRRF